jgi:hypothetical protein
MTSFMKKLMKWGQPDRDTCPDPVYLDSDSERVNNYKACSWGTECGELPDDNDTTDGFLDWV